ncbi:MAG: hypothetical protein ACPGSC_05610 [Granulosicoccaceae bacterium]
MISDLIAAVGAELLRFDLSGQFMWLILIAFVSFCFRLALRGPGDAWVQSASSTLLSMGVLGTFAGVVVGLSGFKHHQISEGLGEALTGLSTAFYSSLLAMALSLVFKMVQVRALQHLKENEDIESTDDIAERLLIEASNSVKQLRQLNTNAREHAEYLIHITNAVADHSDQKGLLGQMALQRRQAEHSVLTLSAEVTQLREQGQAVLDALLMIHQQQQAQTDQLAYGERELKMQFDSLQQVLMTMPNRRDFRSLSAVIADKLAPEPLGAPRRGVRP